MDKNNGYDFPDKNATVITHELTIVELLNYDTVGIGSITLKHFVKLFFDLTDPQSDFYDWYSMHKIENIDQQYDDLKGALYFNEPIDSIREKMYNVFKNTPKMLSQIRSFGIAPTELKIHAGGVFLEIIEDFNKFVVTVVKYITDDTDQNNIHINDIFAKIMTSHFIRLHRIHGFEKQMHVDNDRIKTAYFNDAYITLAEIISYKWSLEFINKRTHYATTVINNAINIIITDYKEVTHSKSLVDFLQNFEKKEFSGLDLSNHKEMKKIIASLNKDIVAETAIMSKNLNILSSKFTKEQIEQYNEYIQKLDKLIVEEIKEKRQNLTKPGSKSNSLEYKKKLLEKEYKVLPIGGPVKKTQQQENKSLNTNLPLNDVSGFMDFRRRVFLVKISKNENYAIKISTDTYPQYKLEGSIYTKFRNIIADPNEAQANKIANNVLKSYYFGRINNIETEKAFHVYVTSKIGFIVSEKVNTELFNAIKKIASSNNDNSVYYYTTENILGQWDQLSVQGISGKPVCSLMLRVFRLLTYLNEKYNFIHWDLHSGNIFVNKTYTNKIKIYDFDLSEIEPYSNIDTSINNFRLRHNNILEHATRNERNRFGLIYDIYLTFQSFNNYETCSYPNLETLMKLKLNANKQIDNADELEKENKWTYFLKLAQVLNTEANHQTIRKMFSNYLVGGSFQVSNNTAYDKYMKYKTKYLQLKY